MTEEEYKNQSERTGKYESAKDKISVLERKKLLISAGIYSVKTLCADIDFEYLGNDFKNRFTEHIIGFFDAEIEKIKREMEII